MFDAIVLTGGRGSRLGGQDKASLELRGETFLHRALAGVGDAERTIVVGPRLEDRDGIVWALEDPPGSGPVAAIGAGLAEVERDVVVILAVDYPYVDRVVVNDLVALARSEGAAALEDGSGRLQPLAGAYLTEVLRRAFDELAGPVRDAAVRDLLSGLDVRAVPHPVAAQDIDTDDDLSRMMEVQ
jgi:molybdopterin-guanine dinucleotide biosynthesis protein A